MNSVLYMTLLLPSCLFQISNGLSSSVTDVAQQNKGRLFEGLYSPAGKLTISPELIITNPKDPTGILLQNNALNELSERMRTKAKPNAVFIGGNLNAVRTFCTEQEIARGSFPGPIPVVYCGSDEDDDAAYETDELVESGASGIMIRVCKNGNEINTMEELLANDEWVTECKAALACGIQPIPEIILGGAGDASWEEKDIEQMIATITEAIDTAPVAVVLTVNPPPKQEKKEGEGEEKAVESVSALPKIPKALGKTIPILGSVSVKAGKNRIGTESNRMKEAGFTGAFLRHTCLPGLEIMTPDLNMMGLFWSAAVSDLKSTRSKSFEFTSKNNMSKKLSTQWATYQEDVITSGALGDPNDISNEDIDEEAGDYKGF